MGRSARAAVLAMGGNHHALGAGDGESDPLSFQPLRNIDRESERSWAAEWLGGIFAQERVLLTPEIQDALWSDRQSVVLGKSVSVRVDLCGRRTIQQKQTEHTNAINTTKPITT